MRDHTSMNLSRNGVLLALILQNNSACWRTYKQMKRFRNLGVVGWSISPLSPPPPPEHVFRKGLVIVDKFTWKEIGLYFHKYSQTFPLCFGFVWPTSDAWKIRPYLGVSRFVFSALFKTNKKKTKIKQKQKNMATIVLWDSGPGFLSFFFFSLKPLAPKNDKHLISP